MSLKNAELIRFLVTFVVGIGIGTLFTWFVLPMSRHGRQLQKQLKATEEKLARYQNDVHDHFSKTSTLINQLTTTYHSLHKHLSVGAYTLGNQSLSNESGLLRDLEFPQFEITGKNNTLLHQLNYPSISVGKKEALAIVEEPYI